MGKYDGKSYHKDREYKDRIYYNVSIPHNDNISIGGSPTPAVFSEVRSEPILPKTCQNYVMSVIRFTIPTTYIPIQYFPVEYDIIIPENPNKSIYSITLSYNGSDFQEFLEWKTQAGGTPIPPPPGPTVMGNQTQRDPQYLEYYSLYSYNHFTSLINNALKICFTTNIEPLLPVIPIVVPPAIQRAYEPPYISFNSSTKLFTLYTQNIFLDSETLPVNIYFNTFLNENFDTSFDTTYFSYTAGLGKNVKFNIIDRGEDYKIEDPTAPDGYIYKQVQEYSTLGQMTSFTSIIIKSNSIPVRPEIISLQGPNYGNIATNSESILTDFEIDISDGFNLKSFIHYTPTAEYRRVNMAGNSYLNRIDLQVFWKDNYDNLYIVQVPAHDIITIKILFEEI